MRAAVYARVSTLEQEPENQLRELRRFVEARGWEATEFVDRGVSGTKESRPALDAMLRDVRRRRFDSVVCWRLDRLGRNLRHLVLLLDELNGLDVGFTTLGEGIDTTTPVGRLTVGLLSAVASFERERIVERVKAGLARAKAQGKRLGRPRKVTDVSLPSGMTVRQAATLWGVSPSTAARRINRGESPANKVLRQTPQPTP